MESNQGPYYSQEPDPMQSGYPQPPPQSGYPQPPPYQSADYPPGAPYGQGQQAGYGQGSYPVGQQYPPTTGYPVGPRQVVYAPQRLTNGLAVASMVLGIVWIYWIGSILALIFGYVARRQIKERGQNGDGMAIAGIVLGWVGVGVAVIFIVIAISAASAVSTTIPGLVGS